MSIALVAPIQESLPFSWFFRKSFAARSVVLFVWLLMACVLAFAYKSNLLAILVTIHYEKPIDSAQTLWESGLTLVVPGETVVHALVKSSPNPQIRMVAADHLIVFDFAG